MGAWFDVVSVFAESVAVGVVDYNMTRDPSRGDNAGESGSLHEARKGTTTVQQAKSSEEKC